MTLRTIDRPDGPALDELCQRLAARADELDAGSTWPAEQLSWCGDFGVFRWFVAESDGGFGWSDADIARGYLRLAESCMTTTFVITQRSGACQRLAGMGSEALKARLLPDLLSGRSFATIGISHLTTSRRHLKAPVLRAIEHDDTIELDGYSPWVTGASHAQHVVLGATLDDDRQLLVVVPTVLPGVQAMPPERLLALSGSHTGAMRLDRVFVPREFLLAGPVENVMAQKTGGNTGGLQTSALAVGLAKCALAYLRREAERRAELWEPAMSLAGELESTRHDMLERAGGAGGCTLEELRARANSLVLRTTQAALAAAKGAGYVAGHPVGRWCREGLFFLVWSCPQPVVNAALCELAGLATE